MPQTIDQRISKRVNKIPSTGCWEWTGWLDSGRPKITIDGKPTVVARLMCKGITPETLACHTCDNPICVNPDHLFPGTHQENSDDRAAKGRVRVSPSVGEMNPMSTLLRVDVEQIHLMSSAGLSSRKIAEFFPVRDSTIRKILRGERWASVFHEMRGPEQQLMGS